jgi:hypothetical protein
MSATTSPIKMSPSLWDFNADSPIASFADDKLGREFFARHLTQVLLQTVAIKDHLKLSPESIIKSMNDGAIPIPESYTVAVFGAWGSGKTSLKNLICAGLNEAGNVRPHIAHFEPRRWRDEDSIIRDFFSVIASQVITDGSPEAAESAQMLIRLGDYLSLAQVTLLLSGLSAVAGGYYLGDPSLGTVGAANITAGSGFFGAAKDFLKDRGKTKKDKIDLVKNIGEIEKQLKEKMVYLEKPVIVFIDDIDRLSVDEVTLLLQLLKYNANFPNLIYVILGQRDIIDDGLEKLFPKHGGKYLEKFVQLALDLPQVDIDNIRQEVFKTLNFVADRLGYNPNWIRREFGAIYEAGVAPYLPSLRQAHRYANSLRFLAPLWEESGGKRAVHPVDVAALEVVRLYEPDVYSHLRKNKIWLTGSFLDIDKLVSSLSSVPKNGDQQEKSIVKPIEVRRLEELLSVAKNKDALKILLSALVPDIKDIYPYLEDKERPITTNSHAEVRHRPLSFLGSRGIQHERFSNFRSFDRYFLLQIEKSRLSETEKAQLRFQLGNRQQLIESLRKFKADGRLDDAMTEVQLAVNEIKTEDVEEFVTAMMDWGDELPQNGWRPYTLLGTTSELGQLIRTALKRMATTEEAIACFERAARKSVGIHQVIIPTLMAMAPEFPEILQRSKQDRIALEKRIRAIAEIGWQKLEELMKSPPLTPLEDRESLGPILWMWAQKDKKACQEWVRQLIQQPKGLAAFAREMAEPQPDGLFEEESYPAQNQLFSLIKMEDLMPLQRKTTKSVESNPMDGDMENLETKTVGGENTSGNAPVEDAVTGAGNTQRAIEPTNEATSQVEVEEITEDTDDLITLADIEPLIREVPTTGLDLRNALWVKTFQNAIDNYMQGNTIPYYLMGECPDPSLLEQVVPPQ